MKGEMCKVCKKGYVSRNIIRKSVLIISTTTEIIDCTNLKCSVHMTAKEQWDRFNEQIDSLGKKKELEGKE